MKLLETDPLAESPETQDDRGRFLSFRGLARAVKQFRQDRKDGWKLDLWPSGHPLYDRGGGRIALSSSADGPIGTLARIELNVREGKDPGDGLPPNALNNPNAP